MSQQKKDTEKKDPESARLRFPTLTQAPPKKVLDEMLAECLRDKNRLIELSIEIPKFEEPFRLTVEMELHGERVIWNLYAGEGANVRTLWTYALRDTDMISEVLSLSVSSPPPPAGDSVMQNSGEQDMGSIAAFDWPDSVKAGALQDWASEGATAAQPAATAAPPPAAAAPPPATKSQKKPEAKESMPEPKPFLEKDKPNIMLGQVLVDSGLIPEPILNAALSLQEMVRQSILSPDEATEALRKMHSRGADLDEVVAEVKKKRGEKAPADAVDLLQRSGIVSDQDINKAKQVMEQLRKAGLDSEKANENGQILVDLLRLAGFISDEDIRRAATASSNRPPDVLKTLLSSGAVDSLCFEVASRFAKYVRLGTFKQEQAIIALHYSQRMRTGFEDTVHSMGWKVPIES